MSDVFALVKIREGAEGLLKDILVKYGDNGDGTFSLQSGAELSPGTYLDEQVVSGNTASQTVTPPAGTKVIWMFARGGPAYASVNENASPTTSGYYAKEDGACLIGPFTNITTLGVYAATGDFAHLVFEG